MRWILLLAGAVCFTGLAGAQCPSLNFNSGPFGPGGIGSTDYALTPSGGTAPYTFGYAPGAPVIPGFRISNRPDVPAHYNASATASLVGIPLGASLTTETTFNTTIRLVDSTGCSVDKAVSVRVSPLEIAGFVPNWYAVGEPVQFRLRPVGGSGSGYTYSIVSGALPTGLTLNLSTGEVTGTPSASGQFNWTLRLTDSTGNALQRGFGMRIGVLRISNMGDRRLPLGNINQSYSHTFVPAGGSGTGYRFELAPFSSLPNGLTLTANGLLSGTPTGSNYGFNFTVRLSDSAGNSKDVRFALTVLPVVPNPLTITTGTIADVRVGENFSWGVYLSGGLPPYVIDVNPGSSLPDGAGLVSGQNMDLTWDREPTYIQTRARVPGTSTFTLRVTDFAGNRATRTFTWRAAPIGFFYEYLPVAGQVIKLGVPYEQPLIPFGGTPPYRITPIAAPRGLSVDGNSRLVGTPLENGLDMPFNLRLVDSSSPPNVYESRADIDILEGPTPAVLFINGGDAGILQKGNAFTRNVTVTGSPSSPPNYNVTIASGSLPPGLELLTGNKFNNANNPENAAQIAGTPRTAGSYEVLLRATDALGNIGQRRLEIRVTDLALVNNALASGNVGQAYSETLDVRGGTPPYTFVASSGFLPSGLTLNSSTGQITGTPTTSASVGATFSVTDSVGGTFIRTYTINIYSLRITTPNVLPVARLGQPYSQAMSITPAAVYAWTATGLPGGLSVNASNGTLSGTPTGTGTFTVNVSAGNGSTAVTKTFTLFVQTLQSVGNLTGLPTASLGDFVLGASVNNVLNIFGGTPPYTVTQISGTMPPGLSLQPGNKYSGTSNFGRIAIAGVPTATGSYDFRLRYADSAGLAVDRTVNMNITPLALASTNLRLAYFGQSYSFQLTGVGGGGPYSFALANLVNNVMPPGLALSASGLISGIPSSTGVYSFTIQLTSGALTRRVFLNLTINATSDNRFLTLNFGPILGDFAAGRGASLTLTPINGAGVHAWSIASGSLPPGLALLANGDLPADITAPSAVIAGVPTTPGTYVFRVRVDDGSGTFAVREATLEVTSIRAIGPNTLPFTLAGSVPAAKVGVEYSLEAVCINGKAPCTFTQRPGNFLPAGMTFDANGTLSGIPLEAGNFIVNFVLTDAAGKTLRGSRNFEVFPATRPIGPAGLGSGVVLQSGAVGTAYSFALENLLVTGQGQRPITWTVSSGALPPGMSIAPGTAASSATLTGTPSTAGAYSFTLIATDAAGRQHLVFETALTIGALNVAPVSPSLTPASSGIPYSQTLTASGGTPPYTFRRRFNGDMPVGMILSPSGVLSGTPNTITAYPFLMQIEAVDATGRVFLKRYNFDVGPPGAALPALSVNPGEVNSEYVVGSPAPVPVPITISSTASNFAFTAVAASAVGSWLTVSVGSATTPATINANINVAGLTPNTYNGAITFSSAAAANTPVTLPVKLIVRAAAPCAYSISPNGASVLAAGGPGGISINTTPSCNWSASAPNSWISLTSAGSGSGPGTVNFSVEPNPGSATRTGSISIAGLAYAITQFGSTCAFTLTPPSVNLSSEAEAGIVTLTSSGAGCPWTAIPTTSWLSISGPASGSGSGVVNVAARANPAAGTRTGRVDIGGQTFTVQQARADCTFSLSSAETSIPSTGGPATVNMTAPLGCNWQTDPGPSWISVSTGATGSGSGLVTFTIDPNSSTRSRSAAALIGGESFTITQAGVPCSFSLSANNPVQPVGTGSGNISIAVAGVNCSWTASANATWLALDKTSGSGANTVNFAVAGNGTGTARSATITIAGQNIIVNQSGATCSYALRSPSATVPSSASTSSVGVVTAAGCPWSASSGASFTRITGGASASGVGDVVFNVEANTTGAQREARLTIADQTFTVVQQPAPCSITLGSSSLPVGEFGGPGSFTYTTSVSGCAHEVLSYASWLKVTSASYAGSSGSVAFTTDANATGARTGVVKVGEQSFSVTQSASTCIYRPQTWGATFPWSGGDERIPITFAPAACGAPAVFVNGPQGMVTLTGVTSSAGVYTQQYSVGIYNSFINYVRAAEIVIKGQIYKVKQSTW